MAVVDLSPLRRAAAPIQPQRLAFTILGGHARNARLVWSGGLVEAMAEFGFSHGAARVALGRLVRSDLLARVRDGRFIHYRLTDTGEARMVDGDHRIFTFGLTPRSIDGWTLVWHAMPEDERLARSRLARRLRFLGFGSLQEGNWIAPHNMVEEIGTLLADMGVAGYSAVLVGRPAKPLDTDVLVRRAWNLEDVADRYRTFLAALASIREPPTDDRAAFVARTLLVHIFRQFPSLDPELPSDHMQVAELRMEAATVFNELFVALEEPAQRHFDALTRYSAESLPAAAGLGTEVG